MADAFDALFSELGPPPAQGKPPGYRRRYEAGLRFAVADAVAAALDDVNGFSVVPERRAGRRTIDLVVEADSTPVLAIEVKAAPPQAATASAWVSSVRRSLRTRGTGLLATLPRAWAVGLVFSDGRASDVREALSGLVPSSLDALYVASIAERRAEGVTIAEAPGIAGVESVSLAGLFERIGTLARLARQLSPPRREFVDIEERPARGRVLEREPPPPAALAPEPRRPVVLLVCSEWRSKHGGVATFNREFGRALAQQRARVFCFVPEADESEVRDAAQNYGVELLTAPERAGLSLHERLLRRPPLPSGAEPDVIVGHGRVLGAYAREIQEQFFPPAGRLHVVHTRSEALEWEKPLNDETATTAEERIRVEAELAGSATVVAGVGPRLTAYAESVLRVPGARTPDLLEILPGLPTFAPVSTLPSDRVCLVVGRADDVEVKGLDIAASALRAYGRHPRRFGPVPTLAVRGASRGEEAQLQTCLVHAGGDSIRIAVRTLDADARTVEQDLWRASLLLMPSREEGFGLSALEAIAANVPVLVSDQSGIADVIRLPGTRSYDPRWSVVPVTGNIEIDSQVWSEAIQDAIEHPLEAYERATRLRALMDRTATWDDSAKAVLGAFR